MRVNKKRHELNLERKKMIKGKLKFFSKCDNLEAKEKSLNDIKKQLDRAESKNIYKKNKVARMKSRLEKAFNKLKNEEQKKASS